MDYFAGLDVSMSETHVCVVDRDDGPAGSRCRSPVHRTPSDRDAASEPFASLKIRALKAKSTLSLELIAKQKHR